MNLNDYDAPIPIADEYAPRPRAAQQVAAQHRAQPGKSTHATEPIAPLVLPGQRQYVPVTIGMLIAAMLLIGSLGYGLGHTPAQPLQLPTKPAQAFGADPKISPTPPPEVRTATEAPKSTISAYAAPDGLLLGPIELDREIRPVAHYGTSWIQADVSRSGRVWLRARDVPDIALTGPDLAPVAQTGRGLTLATPEPPEATPEPPAATPTAVPIVVDVPLRVRAEDDCSAEHGRCDPPCTAEHGRCSAGDK